MERGEGSLPREKRKLLLEQGETYHIEEAKWIREKNTVETFSIRKTVSKTK